MSTQLDALKEIESYLTGEMPEEKRSVFETKVRNELNIREDVAITGRLIKAIKGYGFKQMIKKIRAEEFGEVAPGQAPAGPSAEEG